MSDEQIVKKFMYVNRKSPYGTIYALESLEVVLISAAFDQDVSLTFTDDGVYQLMKNQQTYGIGMKNFSSTYSALGDYEIKKIFIDKEYTVRGITKEEGVLNALMMIAELRNHVGIEEYERAQVRVDTNEFLPVVEAELIEQGFRVTALSKTVEQASKIFQGIQATLAVFGGIALIVSAIGMFNTMTVTLLERTKEIGIMRTIGASPTDIKLSLIHI